MVSAPTIQQMGTFNINVPRLLSETYSPDTYR